MARKFLKVKGTRMLQVAMCRVCYRVGKFAGADAEVKLYSWCTDHRCPE